MPHPILPKQTSVYGGVILKPFFPSRPIHGYTHPYEANRTNAFFASPGKAKVNALKSMQV
jgi:hypothetical protein